MEGAAPFSATYVLPSVKRDRRPLLSKGKDLPLSLLFKTTKWYVFLCRKSLIVSSPSVAQVEYAMPTSSARDEEKRRSFFLPSLSPSLWFPGGLVMKRPALSVFQSSFGRTDVTRTGKASCPFLFPPPRRGFAGSHLFPVRGRRALRQKKRLLCPFPSRRG